MDQLVAQFDSRFHLNPAMMDALVTERAPARQKSRRQQPVSATILVKNGAARLEEVLLSLAWCDEIVVLDTGSTDETMTIARRHANVTLHRLTGAFPGFGRAHRRAVEIARNDWIISIDSDEVVSAGLAAEIEDLSLDSGAVYTIPFHNYFRGRFITSCGWYPDRHGRLFNRRTTNFCESEVHEKIGTKKLSVLRLSAPIHHYSYESSDDFLRKMRSYGQLFATQNAGRKSSGSGKAVSRSLWAFAKSYLFQRGFLQGYEGLVISAYKAQTVFWKYLLLHEANLRNT